MSVVTLPVRDPLNELIQIIHQRFIAGLKPDKARWLGRRPDRGLQLASSGAVFVTSDPNIFEVYSSSNNGKKYTVNLDERTCTCPDCSENGYVCKHRIAAYYFREALLNEQIVVEAEDPRYVDLDEHPRVVLDLLGMPNRQPGDYIVYAELEYGSETILVEVIETERELSQAFVRTLPVMNDDGEYKPIFPFPFHMQFPGASGDVPCCSSAYVDMRSLANVRVSVRK